MTKLNIGEAVRQGDVLVVRIANGELPSGVESKAIKGQQVLAYGEATGHCHALPEEDCELYVANDNICKIAAKYGVKENLAVTHGLRIIVDNTKLLHGTPSIGFKDPDHDPISLPKGDYIILRPREYSDDEEFKVIVD